MLDLLNVLLSFIVQLELVRYCILNVPTVTYHIPGRTGTLVAIEYMLQTIINGDGPYDMREMVKALRSKY